DAATNQPVSGARISALADPAFRAVTDSTGIAEVTLRSDLRLLVTTRLGFRPDTSAISADGWAAGVWVVRLAPNAQPLTGVAVSGTSVAMNPMMMEFETRRAHRGGGASFIGPEVFEKSHTGRITDILRRGVQGVKLIDSSGVTLPVSSRGPVMRLYQDPRGRATDRGTELANCVLRIFVDGSPKEWGFDLSLLEAKDIYGVEVYAGPGTIPAQYRSMGRDGFCGVILIWTRPR
ncbi:MAG: hypothetical protein H7066_11440, partial [Cytophagaceae bacterium]|nr:hypothetical protein [Gemmatimonadaceae bacterium]